jgi:hypothetical protein
VSISERARAARGQLEDVLGRDVDAWPWSSVLSLWIDLLVILEGSV